MTDEPFNADEIAHEKTKVADEVRAILRELKTNYPDVMEGIGAALGAAGGGAVSLGALWGSGSVVGLSASGITSGLAAAGALVGGGMVAGISVLAAPVAVLGIAGYWLMGRNKKAKLAAALGTAIGKLYDIQARLMQNAEYFRDEIAGIKATIQHLLEKKNEI